MYTALTRQLFDLDAANELKTKAMQETDVAGQHTAHKLARVMREF